MKRAFILLISGIAIVGGIACGGGNDESKATPVASKASPQMNLSFHSPAFEDGESMPVKYTCDGENVSPPLEWGQPPQGTQSFALIVDDPDAPSGTFVHWVYYDLPSELRGLPEGVGSTEAASIDGTQGNNGTGKSGYTGPCPPSGTHHYVFRLFALDINLEAGEGLTEDQLLEAIKGHDLATGEFTGVYARTN